ncbi:MULTISPECIES: hypothetical protein [Sphingobacterium]|uniref:hypothetical protein n=1 Tax=Sphingobacterium TaxID=28453 RepID=UPI00257C81F4|nr:MULTISPECIES: hypothetical protein [Sphingobacterium]
MIEWNGMVYHIIGVIEDIVSESPYRAVTPSIYHILAVTVHLNPARSINAGLAAVGKVFTAYNPSEPFEYQFVDDQYAEKFSDDVT